MTSEELTLTDIDNASEEELQAMLESTSQAGDQEDPASDTPGEQNPDQSEEDTGPSVEDRLKALEELNAKLEKRLRDKDEFIEKRNAEVGLLRKQARERELASIPDDVDVNSEEFMLDPKSAVDKILEAKKKKEEILNQERSEQIKQLEEQTKTLLKQVDPEFEDTVPSIIDVLKQDQAPQHIIDQFQSQPYRTFNPAVVLQLIHRAKLSNRVKELEAELAKAKSRPAQIVDNINKHGSAKSKVASVPPTAPRHKKSLENLTEADLDRMSYEELQALQDELVR